MKLIMHFKLFLRLIFLVGAVVGCNEAKTEKLTTLNNQAEPITNGVLVVLQPSNNSVYTNDFLIVSGSCVPDGQVIEMGIEDTDIKPVSQKCENAEFIGTLDISTLGKGQFHLYVKSSNLSRKINFERVTTSGGIEVTSPISNANISTDIFDLAGSCVGNDFVMVKLLANGSTYTGVCSHGSFSRSVSIADLPNGPFDVEVAQGADKVRHTYEKNVFKGLNITSPSPGTKTSDNIFNVEGECYGEDFVMVEISNSNLTYTVVCSNSHYIRSVNVSTLPGGPFKITVKQGDQSKTVNLVKPDRLPSIRGIR